MYNVYKITHCIAENLGGFRLSSRRTSSDLPNLGAPNFALKACIGFYAIPRIKISGAYGDGCAICLDNKVIRTISRPSLGALQLYITAKNSFI